MEAQVLTVSSKGQIAIPVSIRNRMSIGKGDKLIVYTSDDAIMLKTINMPSNEELRESLSGIESLANDSDSKGETVRSISKRGRRKATTEGV